MADAHDHAGARNEAMANFKGVEQNNFIRDDEGILSLGTIDQTIS